VNDWSCLVTRLSPASMQVLETALGEALRIGRFWLGVEFLLMGLSKQADGLLCEILRGLEIEPGDFRGALRGLAGLIVSGDAWKRQDVAALGAEALPDLMEADPTATALAFYGTARANQAVITPRLMAVLDQAVQLAGEGQVEPGHLLLAALQHSHCVAVSLLFGLAVDKGHDPRDIAAWVHRRLGGPARADHAPLPGGQREPVRPLAPGSLLSQMGRDLSALAHAGELHPAIGESAHRAMLQMGQILQQTEGNNPILLGEPGVGKTAIVEGFAWRLAVGTEHGRKPVVPQLANRRIVDLSPAALLAGTKYRGEMEERLQKLLQEVRAAEGQVVVFIDEIHTILGGRAEGGLGAMSDVLKPALARGEFPCIGATTVAEYRRYIEADPALARRFSPVWIEEPTVEEAIEIATTVAQEHLGPSHGVTYPNEVIRDAVQLSVRYIHDEFLPGKVLKLLDQAGPRVTLGGSLSGLTPAPVGGTEEGRVVTIETIRAIISERSGVPLTQLSRSDQERLLQLEDTLKARVKGQDEAVAQVARVVKRARAGLSDPRRPVGVLLFAGPTGVGKTELALAVAAALFEEEDAIFRLDMSEYMEKHQVSRLIGAPPGYIGYEEEGRLTGRLRRRPYSVILLDEIEKAHEDVQHLFLQLFDAGRLTDSQGHLADGRNAIFIMTTNLGAREALGFRGQESSYRRQFQAAVEEHFSPEFLNRVDRIICFDPLSEATLLLIFDKQFSRVATRMQTQGVEVEATESYRRALVRRCARESPQQGARPLIRIIEEAIVEPLTDRLLDGTIRPGMHVVVDESGITLSSPGTAIHSGGESGH